jgi:hypothetical protein
MTKEKVRTFEKIFEFLGMSMSYEVYDAIKAHSSGTSPDLLRIIIENVIAKVGGLLWSPSASKIATEFGSYKDEKTFDENHWRIDLSIKSVNVINNSSSCVRTIKSLGYEL